MDLVDLYVNTLTRRVAASIEGGCLANVFVGRIAFGAPISLSWQADYGELEGHAGGGAAEAACRIQF